MRSIKILVAAFAMALSAKNVYSQSLLDMLIPILEDAVGSGKSPKAAPVAINPPTPSVVKKVVAKVKGGKKSQDTTTPDNIIESSPPSTIASDVPSTIASDAPSNIISDAPSSIISDAPSSIINDVTSDTPSDVVSDTPSLAL